MFKYSNIVLLTFVLLIGINSYGQFDTEYADSTEVKILYKYQRSYGVTAHNLGLGVQYRWGKRLSIFKSRVFEAEFQTLRSWKQIRLINSYVTNSKSYIYGKINDAFTFRFGMLWKKQLNQKPYWGGIELRWIYGGGLTLGLAKPYYLYVIYFYEVSPGVYNYDVVTEKFTNNPQWDDIYGRAPFSKGFNEITVHPGLYLKTGLNFDYSKDHAKISTLEVGAALDVLPTGLTIMYNNPKQMFFPTLYLNFSWGKRYNKY
jgi:hypothetical protein